MRWVGTGCVCVLRRAREDGEGGWRAGGDGLAGCGRVAVGRGLARAGFAKSTLQQRPSCQPRSSEREERGCTYSQAGHGCCDVVLHQRRQQQQQQQGRVSASSMTCPAGVLAGVSRSRPGGSGGLIRPRLIVAAAAHGATDQKGPSRFALFVVPPAHPPSTPSPTPIPLPPLAVQALHAPCCCASLFLFLRRSQRAPLQKGSSPVTRPLLSPFIDLIPQPPRLRSPSRTRLDLSSPVSTTSTTTTPPLTT